MATTFLTSAVLLFSLQHKMLIGGYNDKGLWIEDKDMGLVLKGGESVETFNLKGITGTATLKKPIKQTVDDGPAPEWGIELENHSKFEKSDFAISKGSKIFPRLPKVLPTKSALYEKVVNDWLNQHGLKQAKINLVKAIRIDLDGDGTEEVVISSHPSGDYLRDLWSKKPYCVILVRKLVKGVVTTIAVYSDIAVMGNESVFYNVEVQAVADLDGDGNMEIITSFDYYEGVGHCVFRIEGSKAVKVGCASFGA
jgi:hypothetical protein